MSHASVLVAVDVIDPTNRREIETQVQFQMEPFDENDECFRDGSRWDWYVIGGRYKGRFAGSDIVRVADLNEAQIPEFRLGELKDVYERAAKDRLGHREMVFGVDPDTEPLDAYLSRMLNGWFPPAYAFLRDRHWHEGERMGWFGCSAKTECEIRNPNADIGEMIRRCKTKDEKTGAHIIVWNEPQEIWRQEFYKRFVQPLKPETMLVIVDYHV